MIETTRDRHSDGQVDALSSIHEIERGSLTRVTTRHIHLRLSHKVDDIIVGYLSVWLAPAETFVEVTVIAAEPAQWVALIWELRHVCVVVNEKLLWRI